MPSSFGRGSFINWNCAIRLNWVGNGCYVHTENEGWLMKKSVKLASLKQTKSGTAVFDQGGKGKISTMPACMGHLVNSTYSVNAANALILLFVSGSNGTFIHLCLPAPDAFNIFMNQFYDPGLLSEQNGIS